MPVAALPPQDYPTSAPKPPRSPLRNVQSMTAAQPRFKPLSSSPATSPVKPPVIGTPRPKRPCRSFKATTAGRRSSFPIHEPSSSWVLDPIKTPSQASPLRPMHLRCHPLTLNSCKDKFPSNQHKKESQPALFFYESMKCLRMNRYSVYESIQCLWIDTVYESMKCHPERSLSQSYRERRSRRTCGWLAARDPLNLFASATRSTLDTT
jgi:hypothetical protein